MGDNAYTDGKQAGTRSWFYLRTILSLFTFAFASSASEMWKKCTKTITIKMYRHTHTYTPIYLYRCVGMVSRLGKVAGVVSDKPWAWIKANYDNNKDLTRERKRLRTRERERECRASPWSGRRHAALDTKPQCAASVPEPDTSYPLACCEARHIAKQGQFK